MQRTLAQLATQIAACPHWTDRFGIHPNTCAVLKALRALFEPSKASPASPASPASSSTLPHEQALVALLRHPHHQVRFAVAWLFNDKELAQRLSAAGVDTVFAAAARVESAAFGGVLGTAIGHLAVRPRRYAAAKRFAATHPNAALRAYVLLSLPRGRKGDRLQDALSFVVVRARQDKSPQVRKYGLAALHKHGTTRATEVCALLLDTAKGKATQLSGRAAWWLAEWKHRCRTHYAALLTELRRRLQTKTLVWEHAVSLLHLCAKDQPLKNVRQRCLRLARQIVRSKHVRGFDRAQALDALRRGDDQVQRFAKRFLKDRSHYVRDRALAIVDPARFVAVRFMRVIMKKRVQNALFLIAHDRRSKGIQRRLQSWIRRHGKAPLRRYELVKVTPFDITTCWRKRWPGTRRTGPCRDLRTVGKAFRFLVHGRRHHRPLPLTVRVADMHNQPPHPDQDRNRGYRHGDRYQVVGVVTR